MNKMEELFIPHGSELSITVTEDGTTIKYRSSMKDIVTGAGQVRPSGAEVIIYDFPQQSYMRLYLVLSMIVDVDRMRISQTQGKQEQHYNYTFRFEQPSAAELVYEFLSQRGLDGDPVEVSHHHD